MMFDREEFERWMAQASDTLKSSRQDYSTKSYNVIDVLMDYSKTVFLRLENSQAYYMAQWQGVIITYGAISIFL